MKSLLTKGALALCVVAAFACKKKKHSTATETSEEAAPVVYDNYSRLKTGNYWVYGRYQVEADGTVTELHQSDSCYIDKDTTIRGQRYFKLHKHDFIYDRNDVLLLRDSLECVVDAGGHTLFSSKDFATVFETFYFTYHPADSIATDTICRITRKMDDKDLAVSLPAGRFVTSCMKSTYAFCPHWIIDGRTTRYRCNRYAKDIGLVSETEEIFMAPPYTTERRLLRYGPR